jgi:hypothetical protein
MTGVMMDAMAMSESQENAIDNNLAKVRANKSKRKVC